MGVHPLPLAAGAVPCSAASLQQSQYPRLFEAQTSLSGAGVFNSFSLRLFPPSSVKLGDYPRGGFLDGFSHRFTVFAGALLNPAQQFLLLTFGELEIVIRKLGPLLF